MIVSDKGLMEIIRHEGIVATRYKDSVGVWTVGIGHTAFSGIPPDPETIVEPLTLEQIIALFRRTIARFES